MTDSFVICPICRSPNHPNAAICATCGTTLRGLPAASSRSAGGSRGLAYDYRYGESDLYESDLHQVARHYLIGFVALTITVMFVGIGLAFGPMIFDSLPSFTRPGSDAPIDAPTARPTLALPTVTPAPPTMTPSITPQPTPTVTMTSTREPCIQTMGAGEGLYAAAARCGHLSFDVLDLIVEINGLTDVNSVQEGQVLEIPWPTETPDPNAVPTAAGESENAEGTSELGDTEVGQVSAFDENFDPLFVPTATLPPGVMFHTVQAGETIIVVAVTYGANVEILSQLNPEVTFSQCDFGLDFGGPRCNVALAEGQRLRVPAPTPTPTIPPTASGSETPTPTATTTFNAPISQSPSDRALFLRDQLVTLRWSPSGTLSAEQAYFIRVEDQTEGIVYTAQTRNTSFIIPAEWQGGDGQRHEYMWTVSLIEQGGDPQYTTQPLTFIWEGQEEE